MYIVVSIADFTVKVSLFPTPSSLSLKPPCFKIPFKTL